MLWNMLKFLWVGNYFSILVRKWKLRRYLLCRLAPLVCFLVHHTYSESMKMGEKDKESLPHSYRISYRNEDKRSGKEDNSGSRQLHSCVMNVAGWRHTHCGQTIVTAVAYYMAGSNTFLTDSTFYMPLNILQHS